VDDVIVLVPDELGERMLDGVDGLRAVRYELGSDPSPEQLAARIVVLHFPDVEPTIEFLGKLPHLQYVQAMSAGYEQWVDRMPPGVLLANVRGAHGIRVAEWVVAMLLSHYRQLPGFAADQRAGHWNRHPSDTLLGKRVTVLGAGDIAERTRQLLEPFGCPVRFVGSRARSGVIDLDQYSRDAGDDDVVVIAVPVSPATRGLVDAAFLARLKDGAVVVNAARGVIVDTDALAAEAASGRIYGILDVVEPEPLPDGHPLWSTPGITITPHVAGSIPRVWERAWDVGLENLRAFVAGNPPENLATSR